MRVVRRCHTGLSFILLAGAVALTSVAAPAAESAAETRKDKASFLTPKEQSFIRPGLEITVTNAWIDEGSVPKFQFKLTDSAGAPLDIEGVFTPGAVVVRPVLAYIPQGSNLYTAYTARSSTSSITGMTATQADRDRNGTIEKVGDGEYVWTFGLTMPGDYDPATTHTVAVWANRDLEEFELGEQSSADTFDWVPAGGEPNPRRVVTDASCNACHGELSAHDNRTTVDLCVTCHQPQSSDPDTGNTVDFAAMVHKIHMGAGLPSFLSSSFFWKTGPNNRGAGLPSVQNGEPYQIIGFGGSVHDYSNVVFPADVRNCSVCHAEDRAALPAFLSAEARVAPTRARATRARTAALSPDAKLQNATANYHLLNPSRRACGSCHDNVNFATGENHAGLPQLSDNQCSRCHAPQGELEYDLSILGAHTVERFSNELAGTNFELIGVTNTAPGQNPIITFDITNDAGARVAPADMGRLALVMAGGNGVDFGEFFSENATSAEGSGPFTYTFNTAIPEGAAGRWAIGIEGYQNGMILPGTQQERSVRDAGDNVVLYFDVAGGPASARRMVVSQAKCDTCHFDLSLHGDNRNNVEHCVLCHNPMTTDVARRPDDAGAPESVNFKDMIHRIHAGEELTRDLTIYGFGGTPHNYNEVVFPRDLAACTACHIDGTEELPVPQGAMATVNPRDFLNPTPPASAACLSCHTQMSAAAHADLNISPSFGESCDVCHGPGSEFAVDKVHAQ